MKNVLIFILLAFFTYESVHAGNPAVIYGSGGTAKVIPSNGLSFKDGETLSGSEAAGLKSIASTGNLSGGAISIGTPTSTLTVAAGVGYVLDDTTDPANPAFIRVEYGPFTNVAVTNIGTSLFTTLSVDASGSLIQRASLLTRDVYRTEIFLGFATHPDFATVVATQSQDIPISNAVPSIADLAFAIGDLNLTGNVFSAGGANLTLQRNAGTFFKFGVNAGVSNDPHTSATLLESPVAGINYSYRDGVGGFIIDTAVASIDPDNYDDGSGTLATVANNRFTVQQIYYRPSFNVTYTVYGVAEYSTLAGAEAAIFAEDIEVSPNVTSGSLFRAWMIVKEGVTDLQAAVLAGDAKFIAAGKFGQSVGSGSSSATTTLQVAYDNSVQPQITLDAIRSGLQLLDASTTIGAPFLEVLSNDTLTKYLSVDINGLNLGSGVPVNAILDEDDMLSDSATALATQQSIKAYADSILPDQTGNSGKVLSTSGFSPSWRVSERLNARVKDNLLENPSFENTGDSDRVITVGSGIDFSGQSTRTAQASPHNINKFQLSSSAASTLSYVQDKTGDFDARQMVTFCEIKTSRTDVKFKSRVNGVTDSELTVDSNNKWRYYKLPFVGGNTSNGFEIVGDTNDANGFEFDNCYLGNGDNITSQGVNALTAETKNSFAVSYSTLGVPDKDDFDIMNDSDCTLSGAGNYIKTCTYKFPFTSIPIVVANICDSGTGARSVNLAVTAMSLTGFEVNTRSNDNASGVDEKWCANITKTGADVNLYGANTSTVVTESTSIDVPIVTEWTDYTPDSNAVVNATVTGKWRQVGEDIEVKARITWSGANTSTSTLYIGIPSGLTIDTSKLTGTDGSLAIDGSAILGDNSVGNYIGSLMYNTTTSVRLRSLEQFGSKVISGTVNPSTSDPFVIASGDKFDINFKVPIVGWTATEKKAATIHGTFEQIKTDDLASIYVGNGASAEPISPATENIKFDDTYRNDGLNWDATERAYIASKIVEVSFEGMTRSASTVTGQSVYTYIDTGSGYAQENRVGFANGVDVITKFSGKQVLNAGDKLAFRWAIAATTNNTKRDHWLKIKEQPDTTAIVRNLLAGASQTVCETKILSANVTTTGTIADWSFTGLTIGKRYSIDLMAELFATAITNQYMEIDITDDIVIQSIRWKLNSSPSISQMPLTLSGKEFTAATTTLDISIPTKSANADIISGDEASYVRLCQLPDTHIQGSF